MKYSQLFGKTIKGEVGDSKFPSHTLLTRGGFIAESTAGRYFFLPLGWRVHDKIKAIIKDEMDKAGAQEMITPILHPLELWQETNRTNTAGFELTTLADRRGAEFALGGTAEEMMVDVVRKQSLSYRDLPFTIYQFSTKFRDELRARGGLLRVREFVMKDGYSFSQNEADFKIEYDKMAAVYSQIFSRMGLETSKVEADNGYIGGEYCHEYQVTHPDGEGTFFTATEGEYCAHEDVAQMALQPINPDEAVKPMETIEQPEWVKTMADNEKHYGKDARYFLKNVCYRSTEGDIVIAVIRGDLDVNKTKLEHVLNLVGQLEDATEEDLASIGTQRGHVHSWGHAFVTPRPAKTEQRDCRVIYVADNSLKTVTNFIGGQKETTTDTINVNCGRDFSHEIEADIALAVDGAPAPNNQGTLTAHHGIEVGNIFQLGFHYTNLMKNANFIGEDGKPHPYYMGCYGIGLGRTMAAVVELHHDEKGIIWPESIAPYQVHLISLPGREEDAAKLYQELIDRNVEVLWDDRPVSPGNKFADADLIGCPIRLLLSQKTGEQIEWKLRAEKESELVSHEELIKRLTKQPH
jgi:prolyl-tRNA synthetase